MHEANLPPTDGKIDPLIRTVGKRKEGQCIWGFINSIRCSKNKATDAAEIISQDAVGDAVWFMPNDTAFLGTKGISACIVLKLSIDTPIIERASKFL